MYDVIVVGAGHNGLTAGAYLARAGKKVLVLEAQDSVGGMAYTKELAGAPGFKVSPCAVDLDFFAMPGSVADELALHEHGMKLLNPDPWGGFANPDGASVVFWKDLGRTVDEIARYSRRDAERYEQMMTVLGDFFDVLMPYLQGHPRRVEPRAIGEIAWRMARKRKSLGLAARILASSPAQVLEEWFEREEVRTPMAVMATLNCMPLDAPGTSWGLLFAVIMHKWGVSRPVGGTGVFTQALASYIRAHGGGIRTNARVERVVVRADRAAGVVLASGEEIAAADVLASLDPTTLLTKFIEPDRLSDVIREELRGMSVWGSNISHYKADVALSQRPELRHGRTRELMSGVLLHATDLASVRRATNEFAAGLLGEEYPLMICMPTVHDRTLVPAGSEGDSLYMWGIVPYQLRDGSWDGEKEKYTERWIDVVDQHSPGAKESVIAVETSSPADFERKYGSKGHLYHADVTPSQFGPWRPIPSLGGYQTPLKGLWHAGAGSHPLPGVNGWSGRTAARTVLKAQGRNKDAISR